MALGAAGEEAAAQWYLAHGYEILDRNWRVRQGEIDLICRRGTTVVFVEVKTRSSTRFGSGAAAVTWKKQQRIRELARRWLAASTDFFPQTRFDVVDVDGRGNVVVIEGCF